MALATVRVVFYFEAASYPLNIYPSTTLRAVTDVLWRQLRLQSACTEDEFASQVLFTNEAGEIVVWSPASIPSGVSFHVLYARPGAIKVAPATAPVAPAWLRWSAVQNAKLQRPYVLSVDGTLATVDQRLPSGDCAMLVIAGDSPMPLTGVHTFRVRFDRNITYMSAGVIDAESLARSTSSEADMGVSFTRFPSLHETLGCADVDWAFSVDMELRTYSVRDARNASAPLKTFKLPGKGSVWIAAVMKAPHACSATLCHGA